MAMRLPGVGSQYLLAMQDADKQFFDGGKTYRLVLPKGWFTILRLYGPNEPLFTKAWRPGEIEWVR